MTATQAPTPGPLSGDDVKLLVKLLDTLKPFAEVAEKLKHCHVVEICEPTPDNPSRNIIPMPREWFERAGDDLEYIAIQLHASGVLSEGQASKITGLDRVSVRREVDRLAPTSPVEASGSEREEDALEALNWIENVFPGQGDTNDQGVTVRGWHRLDQACATIRAALSRPQPSGETREAVLKGVGKVNGDGWKDTTTKGETVFVWNAEKPAPYAPGQYPRVGNEGWSASTSQYDFTPATADDVPAILALLSALALGGQQGEEAPCWIDGAPSGFRAEEWFIARTTYGDRVVLRALPEEYAYDFKTADETYIKRDKITAWMPFPDSQYTFPTPARAEAQDEGAAGERPYPKLLNKEEGKALLALAEELWSDLQANNLGGFSDANRPFYILNRFKGVIEQFGHRDIGQTWSKNQLDAHPSPTPAADADRVRIAVEAITKAKDLDVNLLHDGYDSGAGGGNYVYADVVRTDELFPLLDQALSTLKSTAAKEGGES